MTTPSRRLQSVRSDVALIVDLLAEAGLAGPTATVPACPGWTVRDVVGHLGGVHRMVTLAVRDGERSAPTDHLPDPDTELGPWLAEGADVLLQSLDIAADTPAWTFFRPDRSVGFWQRRQSLETVVHRVDVEQALGRSSTVEPWLAADGLAELIEVLLPLRKVVPEHPVQLVATDTGQRWTVGTEPVAGVASGTVEELFLAVWQRVPVSALELEGRAESVLRTALTP